MYTGTRKPTIIDLALPRAGILSDTLLVFGFGTLTALGAQLAVYLPFSPVPITVQTLIVLLAGVLLGSKRGALSQLSYLAMGAGGLPVFAAGHSGPAYILGPTGGYLIGFVAAAFLTGFLAERGWDRNIVTCVIALALGSATYFALGCAWLSIYLPAKSVLSAGLYPFIIGDALKIGLAATLLPAGWAFIRRNQ